MKFGKRRKDAEPVAEPAGTSAPPPAEPVPVKWAVADVPPPPAADVMPEPETGRRCRRRRAARRGARRHRPRARRAAYAAPPPPAQMPFPVAEQPVAVASSGSDGGGTAPLSDVGAAYASGHAPGTSPSWPEPVMQLANERPEAVVGAAFVGGLLFAAILRRLGN